MKKPAPHPVYLIPLLLLFIFGPAQVRAERVKVKRVKGNNAIIESTVPLEEGQTYQLLPDSISEDVDYTSGVAKPRDNSLTLGTQLDFLKSDTMESTNFSLQARYGWNFSTFEVGGVLGVDMQDAGSGATTTILAGGYVDYNLVANRPPHNAVYGPFVLAAFGSTQYPSSATGGSSTLLQANAGGFLSYFLSGTSTALRAEVYGVYQQVNTDAAQTSVTGGGARGLLLFYF